MKCEKLHEECGIFGITGVPGGEAAGITYNALLALQHRGQESAGIAAVKGNSILYHKNRGLVSEVFSGNVMSKLPKCKLAIGHVRYSTTGSDTKENAQPIITDYFKGRVAISHNGNIINAPALREKMQEYGILFNTSNDSEVISSLIAYEALTSPTIEDAIIKAVNQIKGAYSLVIISGGTLIAVRDPSGFRPLCMGSTDGITAFSSESCALDAAGIQFIRDIKPGELVSVDADGCKRSRFFSNGEKEGLCIFEYVYFARTDSVIDNVSVYAARFKAGRELARQHPVEADLVCGVPDSGLEAAQGYASQSGILLGSAFVKNRYIGRSFIFPSQTQREQAVKVKLNPLKANIAGKRIVLVDDSIVRGTTSAKIIATLKNAGAKEVHLRISSPPFLHTCHFGTDIDDEHNLIARNYSLDEIAGQIGADSLGYISLEGLKTACAGCNVNFCTGCFSGDYPIALDNLHTKNQFE